MAEDFMEYRLPQGRMLRIQRARGWTLHCVEGIILLTQQGDSRDYVLRAGGSVALDTGGRVLLDAHGDARLRLASPAALSAWSGAAPSRPVTVPVVRLLAARCHGSDNVPDLLHAGAPLIPHDSVPLTYSQMRRDPRLVEALMAHAHREQGDMMACCLMSAARAIRRVVAGALLASVGGVARLIRLVAGALKRILSGMRPQLPSVAETFAARVLLRSRQWL